MQSSQSDGAFLPRHVLLHCGIPIERPALGVNRLCGSGFQAIVNGAQDILVGAAKIALTGGVDSMSQAPFVVRNVRFGTALGTNYALEDSLWVSVKCCLLRIARQITKHFVVAWFDRFVLQIADGIDRRKSWRRIQNSTRKSRSICIEITALMAEGTIGGSIQSGNCSI